MVRCQCQNKAKTKKERKRRRRKKFRPVHKEGNKGRAVSKNSRGCSTFLGWKKLWTRDTEGDCWRICVHLNPEREKVTDFLIFCFFLFFLFDRPHQCPLCPPPRSPTEALAALWKMLLEPQTGGSGGWRGGAFSHPRVKYQLWLCEHTHCAYPLAYAHTRCRADLNF